MDYRQLTKGFRTRMTPIINCTGERELHSNEVERKEFEEITYKIIKVAPKSHPDSREIFKVACNESRICIGGVLSQEGHLAYFNGNESKQIYFIYDKESMLCKSFIIRGIIYHLNNLCCIKN